ncbi:hypothetical protein RA13_13565 [Bacillus atrophaeus]|nr:hypothetical protein RA13_13565 [Bacillus atrophaeus]
MKTKKYVRIVRNISKYGDKTGRIFPSLGTSYKIDSPDGGLYVRKSDAEIILTEKRLAAVGDRVLITDTGDPQAYENGKEYEVRQIYSDGVSVIGRSLALFHNEYEVIVNYEVKNEEADGMENVRQTVIDYAYTVFEKNNGQYLGYKSRFGDIVLGGVYSEEFVMNYANVNENVLIVQDSTLLKPRVKNLPEKFAQARRDEIVEQAKADVAELVRDNQLDCVVDLIVNRNKRTVVGLIKGEYTGEVYARGIAKAAPSDCFNVHIGRAIALRRTLGLAVPDEYLNTPQPTEVRVGDVVQTLREGVLRFKHKVKDCDVVSVQKDINKQGTRWHVKIIDDSREEVGK